MFFPVATLDQLKSRILASSRSDWAVTDYCQMKASFRRVDLELAIENICNRSDCFWEFSQHPGIEGTRILVSVRVAPAKRHVYVLEVNAAIYFVNVIVTE